MKKTWNIAKRILSGLITAMLLLILVSSMVQKMSGKAPGVLGYHIMYVMTGSMEPEIMAGDSVFVKECAADQVALGDVICYEGTEGVMAGKMVTHRVVVAPHEENGQLWLQTQGDANAAPDSPITGDRVYGVVIGKSSLVGMLFKFFCTVPGLLTIAAPIVWMMVDEIRHMIKISREEIKEIEESVSAAGKADEENKP